MNFKVLKKISVRYIIRENKGWNRMKKILILILVIIFNINFYPSLLTQRKRAIVLSSPVFIFEGPAFKSSRIGIAPRNSVVVILKKLDKFFKYSIISGKWFYIKTKKGVKGYIFGAFLFELDVLFSKNWRQPPESNNPLFLYKFYRNGKFTLNYKTYNPDKNEFKNKKTKGRFTLKGRQIKLYVKNYMGSLFLFKYRGKNCLSNFNFEINDRIPKEYLFM